MRAHSTKIILTTILLTLSFHYAIGQTVPQKIDSLIQAYYKVNKFNGNILVLRSGQTIFKGAYGYRNIEQHIKNSGEEIFPIASLTKSFTALMIMKLVEDRRLTLTTRVTTFFPALHPNQPITISNLLNHTSGIREVLADAGLREKIFAGMKVSHAELLSYFSGQPLDFEPGTAFAYSNSGYDILGMIIEKITGKTYELAINENIFKPFKMINSGYDYTKLQSKYKTIGYSYISATRHTTAPVWDTSWEYASGGLYSSLSDLAKFDQALRTNQLIRKELLAKTYAPTQWSYGYGWFIHTLFGKKVAYHSGNLEGATSYFGRIPEDDICIIILLNETNTIIESLANKVIAILYDQPYVLPKTKQAIALSDEQLKKYIGTYDISDAYQTSVAFKDHFLYLSTNNMAPVQILPETENRFFISDSNITITFNPDQTGKLALKIQDGLSTKVGGLN